MLSGVLERILYHNEDNHFCVGELSPDGGGAAITIAGKLPGVQCGETLELKGDWDHHPRFGQQFKVEHCTSRLPATVHGIRKYLSSGLVEGIGKVYANKIVDHFGEDTLDVISHFSAKLREVPGIGAKRAKQIKGAWEEQKALRDVMMFLQTYGVGTAQCVRLVKKYGPDTQAILRSEPYRLAREVDGIGFLTADKIALNIGFPNEGAARLDAGLLHAMQTLEGEGHTCVEPNVLVEAAQELLKSGEEILRQRVNALVRTKALVLSPPAGDLQFPTTSHSELKIAEALHLLLGGNSKLPPIHTEKAIDWAQKKAGFSFAPQQADALRMALTSRVSILTGGPGTGKTTILRALVAMLRAKKVRIELGSPTGRAAQRLAESANYSAQTLHRILKYEPAENKFVHNAEQPLNCDYLIVDEASMLDTRLGSAVFAAVSQGAHLLLVGDIDQLPSVGPGNLLKDLIGCGLCAVTRLETIFRQASGSSIVSTAHNILAGRIQLPDAGIGNEKQDFHFLPSTDADECVHQVVELCRKILPDRGYHALSDVQILAPMHRGTVGIHNLNLILQNTFHPSSRGKQVAGTQFRVGDKIIQMRNNYDKNLFNGDVGFILGIDEGSGLVRTEFNGESKDLEKGELTDLSLAYAISIHKSQGSEYPVVILPLMKQHFMMLQRNLIYTGITRGKKEVFLIGEPEAYAMAVRNAKSNIRRSNLVEKILKLKKQ